MYRPLLSLFHTVVFGYLLTQISAWNKFCSVVCTPQDCASMNYADCTGSCSSPWVWNATSNLCEIPTTSGWGFV